MCITLLDSGLNCPLRFAHLEHTVRLWIELPICRLIKLFQKDGGVSPWGVVLDARMSIYVSLIILLLRP